MYNKAEVIILAAYAANRLIGNDSGIPWKNDSSCSDLVIDDITRLRNMIDGCSIILGRKTYSEICAIPTDPIGTKWLTSQVVVMSRDENYKAKHPHVRVENSLEDALASCIFRPIYILGGAEIYKQALEFEGTVIAGFMPTDETEPGKLVDRMEITVIDKNYGSLGVKFPSFDVNDWEFSSVVEKISQGGVKYRFLSCVRK